MEKLIELLNEYEIEKEKSEWVNVDAYVEFKWDYNNNWLVRYDETDRWEWDNLYWDTAVAYLISKSFWFIKWLVENDKIDRYKFEVEYMDKQTLEDVYIAWAKQDELLIMILSISSSPIDDLISYLK
jgi:hypothetical protein